MYMYLWACFCLWICHLLMAHMVVVSLGYFHEKTYLAQWAVWLLFLYGVVHAAASECLICKRNLQPGTKCSWSLCFLHVDARSQSDAITSSLPVAAIV